MATLIDGEPKAAGYHVAIWNGLNHRGASAASGIYLYRLRAGSVTLTNKMALAK